MKKLIYFLPILFMLACNQTTNNDKLNALQLELDKATATVTEEKATLTVIENYLKDIQSSDWKDKMKPYLNNPEETIKEHEKFRTAFSDYKIKTKHLVINGNEAILWATISAVHSGEFDGNETKGTKATGKSISWDEVWQFNIIDGKFGDAFDFIDHGISRMKQLGIKCLPED